MSDSTSSSALLPSRQKSVVLQPGFLRAWQGVWSFTWKSQFTWQRLPSLLVTLLAIPLLAFFTIKPLAQLTGRYDWREAPRQQMNEFRGSAAAAGVALPRDLILTLTQIVAEEQNRVPPVGPPSANSVDASRFSEEALARQIEQARACYEQISERVRPLLDARQFARFQQFQDGKLEHAIEIIRRFNLRQVRPFYRWLVDFYFLLALPLYCLSICGSMIRDELQADTLGFLTTRPVGRAQLFLIKFLCQMTWLQAMVAAHGLLLFAAGFLRQAPGLGPLMGLFFGAQFLAVLAWGGLSALLGLVTRRYTVLGIVYGFVVEIGLGRIPTNINTLSLRRHLEGLLGHNALLNQLYDWEPQGAWLSVIVLLLATALFLGAGAALFTFREYHHATEMQK